LCNAFWSGVLAANAARYRRRSMAARTDVVLLLVALAFAVLALSHWGSRTPALSPERASWAVTPGVVNPEVTSATLASTICKHGWTRTIRPPVSYTNDLKLKQMRAYRRRGPPSAYQE